MIGSGDRSERIRTYNFPQNRITDHRIDLTIHGIEQVLEGNLDPLVEALYEADLRTRAEAITRSFNLKAPNSSVTLKFPEIGLAIVQSFINNQKHSV
jgi:hypothetical protein